MSYIYKYEDLKDISWNEVDDMVNILYKDIKNYIESNNLTIKYISPIARGGDIPAVMLSHMLNVVDMLPIQLKNNNGNIDLKIGLDYVKDTSINDNECILLVDTNHITGRTANIAVDIILDKFGSNTKIIYVTLTRDYTHRFSVEKVMHTLWARLTNESMELSEEECITLNIPYKKISIYPWENKEEELSELNM